MITPKDVEAIRLPRANPERVASVLMAAGFLRAEPIVSEVADIVRLILAAWGNPSVAQRLEVDWRSALAALERYLGEGFVLSDESRVEFGYNVCLGRANGPMARIYCCPQASEVAVLKVILPRNPEFDVTAVLRAAGLVGEKIGLQHVIDPRMDGNSYSTSDGRLVLFLRQAERLELDLGGYA